MHKPIPPRDLSQIEIALEHGKDKRPFNGILVLFWGLIFTKLFLLEYGVQVYDVPINSTIYVWSLTLIMGLLCSVVYVGLVLKKRSSKPLTNRVIGSLWLATLAGVGILALSSIVLERFDPFAMPVVCATALGGGYFVHGALIRFPPFQRLGVAWWVAALVLAALAGPLSMIGFAVALVFLQVIPTAVLHFAPANRAGLRAEMDAEVEPQA